MMSSNSGSMFAVSCTTFRTPCLTLRASFWLLLHPLVSLPFRAVLALPIPARLFAPWSLTVGVALLPFLVVLHLLFPYDLLPLLGVPLSPFLSHLLRFLLMLAFRPQLEFLHLPCLLEGRRDLRSPFGRRPRCLTWSPPLWTWRNSRANILTCAPFLIALDQRAARLRGVLNCVSGWVRAADRVVTRVP